MTAFSTRGRHTIRVAGWLLAALLAPAIDAAPLYTAIELPYSFTGISINASGEIAGAVELSHPQSFHTWQAAVYSGGVVRYLGTLDGTGSSFGNAINDRGEVTGSSNGTGFPQGHAFLYSGGVMRDLGTRHGLPFEQSGGSGINNNGEVTGFAGPSGGFLYSGGVMRWLGTLGGRFGMGQDINNRGEVTGSSDTIGDIDHAFLYSGGVINDLGTLGGSFSVGNAINDNGEVAGSSGIIGDVARHAFRYSGGVMRDLGTLGGLNSSAEGINAIGEVVGWSDVIGDIDRHAFLYSDGLMTDLNLITVGLGDVMLLGAVDINDSGQIVAYGHRCNPTVGCWGQWSYLLNPVRADVPEPGSMALIGLGLLGGLLIGLRRRSSPLCQTSCRLDRIRNRGR